MLTGGKKLIMETLPHGSLIPWKRRRGGCFSSAGGLPGERPAREPGSELVAVGVVHLPFTAGAHACLGEGEKEPERPPRRINRRATMRRKSSSLLLWQDYSATYRPGICTTASPVLSSGLV